MHNKYKDFENNLNFSGTHIRKHQIPKSRRRLGHYKIQSLKMSVIKN